MVQRYTETVGFEDSQRRYVAPTEGLVESRHDLPDATRGLADATRGLSEMTGGLSETSVVPRNRIELLTRGFSVQPSLVMDMLAHLAALGRAAEQLGQALGCSNYPRDHEAKPVPQLVTKIAPPPRKNSRPRC